ncbi:MAG: hypothetical protein ACRC30_14375 [Clostridium sp.]
MSSIALQLPKNYVEFEREEMEYVDGGNDFTNWMFSVQTVGSAVNTVISTAVPGGSIAGYVAKVGTKTAARYLEAIVVNKLKTMGIAVAGVTAIHGLTFALDYIDVGHRFARWLDSIDAAPNNGIVWFGN